MGMGIPISTLELHQGSRKGRSGAVYYGISMEENTDGPDKRRDFMRNVPLGGILS